jgi:hypothetical protein
MSIRDDFRTYLLTKNLTAQVGSGDSGRIYPDFLPQGMTLPAIVLTKVSDVGAHDSGGANTWAVARVQVDCYAGSRTQADTVAEAVRNACDGFSGNTMGSSFVHWCKKEDDADVSFPEPENEQRQRFRVTADYMIAYVQSLPTLT